MQTLPVKRKRQLVDYAHYDFSGGLNIADSPQKLADNELTQCTNMYLSTEGDLTMRNGIKAVSLAVNVGSTTPVATGIFRFYQEIVSGAATYNTITVKQVGGTLYNATTNTQIGTTNQLGASALPMSCARMFDPQHNGGTDILIICVGASGGPFAYDGTTLYNLSASPTTVTGARWVTVINAVAFFAGIPSQPNLVVASYINEPEQTPAYNTFSMSGNVMGLGTLGVGAQTSLAVGLVSGLVLINGFTPNSFFEQEIPTDDGVQSGRSMITVDGVLYFIGNFAIYRYDGTEFVEISRKVRPWILNDARNQNGSDYPMNGDRSTAWAMEWNRRLYFWYPGTPGGGGSTYENVNTALVWDLSLQAWSIYQSTQMLGAGCLLNAPQDADPEVFYVVDQATGTTYLFDVYNSASGPGTAFEVDDNGTIFQTFWQTKFYKIGDPGTYKTLLRLQPELFVYSLSALFNVVTDYGLTISSASNINYTQTSDLWDAAIWDESSFGGSAPAYYQSRIDINAQSEAFAFGMVVPNPNTPTSASWVYRVMGFTGRYSQMPRSSP